MADFRGIQPHPRDAVEPGLGGLQRGEGGVLGQVAQEAEDQLGGDPELGPRPVHAGQQAVHDHGEGDASSGVGLGIEEDLGVDAPVRVQPAEIGQRQVLEVRLGPQHRGALVVDVEEVLQVGEGVGRPHRLHAVERQVQAVAPRQGEHQLGLEAALDVQVQLRLGQAAGEGFQGHRTHLLALSLDRFRRVRDDDPLAWGERLG